MQTKVTPAGGGTPAVTNYLVDTTGSLSQVVAETDGAGALKALYVRADNELLAVLRPTGTTTWATRYVHADGLGSVRVLTDETGTVTDTRDYEAFGTRNETAGSDSLAFGFAGEPYDSLSKLAYHRARWMDPRVGRFLGMDPFVGRLGNPLSLHRFIYAGDNSVNSTDPTGEDEMAEVAAGNIGGAILATLTLSAEFAVANAIACEASLVASFFESPTPTSGSNFCKKRWFNHYTTEAGRIGIRAGGFILLSKSEPVVFLTSDNYFTGARAKSRLALDYVPTGNFRIPEVDIPNINCRGPS